MHPKHAYYISPQFLNGIVKEFNIINVNMQTRTTENML